MVASLNQSPLLTLDALSSCGVVLPTEARAALDTSLTLKARELGVQAFLLWGKFTTSSGRDYYIARAYNGTKRVEGKVIVNPGNKFYYSTDCAEWLDLEPVDGKLGELCGLIDGKRWLTGDPAHEYTVTEHPPTPAPDPETGEEAPTPDPVEHTLTELQRMMATINKINSETACAPDGMYVTDAAGNYVAKPGFFVNYPDQLSSYVAPTGNLGKAAPGTWGLVWDSFKRVATLRSFAYPGFFAYYSSASNTAGNLYFGNGLRNEEVGFV